MKYNLLAVSLYIGLLTGCSGEVRDRTYEIKASKEIVENRKKYQEEISKGVIECIKSTNTITHLTASGNDQEEVVKVCTESVQKIYGAYSPWIESATLEWSKME